MNEPGWSYEAAAWIWFGIMVAILGFTLGVFSL